MSEITTKRYLPKGIDKAPETVVEALFAARTLLAEENRWRQTEWFKNKHPHLDVDDPFCNSWAVCAEGAVALVVVGTFNGKQLYEQHEVYTEGGFDGDEEYIPEPWCVNTELIHSYAQESERQLYDDTVEVLRAEAGRLTGRGEDAFIDAWSYNDNFCTKAQDVLAWFDSAIASVG